MNPNQQFDRNFGNALPPALLILILIWIFYWADSLFLYQFYKLGVLPKSMEGLQGIFLMPLVHSTENFNQSLIIPSPYFCYDVFILFLQRNCAENFRF